MAPLKKGKGSRPQRPTSSRKANAIGFANRQTRRQKSQPGTDDVYDYQHVKAHRQNVRLDLSRDETAGFRAQRHHHEGAADEDDDGGDDGRGHLKVRLVGANDDDDRIETDDDEDIDSDAAYNPSDLDDFAGTNFIRKTSSKQNPKSRKKRKGSARFAQVDLNEDVSMDDGSDKSDAEEEEEDGESDEFIDVLDILDGRGEEAYAPPSRPEPSKKRPVAEQAAAAEEDEDDDQAEHENESGSEDEEGSEEDDRDDEEDIISGSEDDNPAALDDLEKFISSLNTTTTKRKAPGDADDAAAAALERPRKRRLLKDRTEAGPETEFGVRAPDSSKLDLTDLLGPLASQSSVLQSLKSSTKALTGAKGKALDAPLPTRTQERLDRSAAYEQTKEEVDKWKATMKRIREAEHLSFPLQAPTIPKTSNLELAAKFQPMTELESSVDKLLKSAKLREEDIQRTEELKMNHLSVEEVAERRAELRKMRDLMFRAEVKAKRVAKIKSKAYRKIHRKDRQGGGGEEGEEEVGEEGQLKREVERAKERATLRHKNTGKWAQTMRGRGELDVDQRREISEMLERGERLRRKIHGKGSESGSGDEDDDGDDQDDNVEGVQRIKARAFEELAELNQGGDNEQDERVGGKNSVFAMKFMKDAAVRANQRADKMADDFAREMGGGVVGSDDEVEGGEAEPSGGVAVKRTGGRVVYRPGPGVASASASSLPNATEVHVDPPAVGPPQAEAESPTPDSDSDSPLPSAPTAQPNPWLIRGEASSSKVTRKRNEISVGKDSSGADKSKHKLKKSEKKLVEERAREQEDAQVEITMDDVLILSDPSAPPAGSTPAPPAGLVAASSAKKPKKPKKSKMRNAPQVQPTAGDGDDDSDHNSEVEAQEVAAQQSKGKRKGMKAFEQRDLVALAFAGDNVVQAFNDAKQREIAEDAPREVDTTLAGWGSWGGQGTKRQPPKPHLVKKIAGIDASQRADFGKAHVIISEKKDKKAAKYLVKDLPFPYTNRAQFERSIDTPIGPEWNTRVGFQRETLPKVVKKMGTVIMPLEKLHA